MSTELVISIDQLVKRFGAHTALDGMSFTVTEGEVFSLLGPNGAGKTTTVRLLNGLLAPDTGRVRVCGLDPISQGSRIRALSGVLTETPGLYERLTARQNLRFFAEMSGGGMISVESRIGELIDLLDLSDRADEPVAGYSKGMKQRLALARALMHQPPLLYLDEPTSGLDPEAAQQVNELISGLSRKDGRTILLCTHNLVEAQRLSDRVAVLNRGKLLALGTIEDLNRKLFPGIKVEIELVDELEMDIRSSTESLRGVKKLNINGKIMSLELEHREVIPTLVEHLVRYKARVMSVNQITYSLEEIYFQIQQNHQGVDL